MRGTLLTRPADGFTAEMPVFEPSAITITGPEVYINSVSYAWVTFGEDGITSTYSVDTGYTLMDSNGDECSTTGITCSTDTVKATLPLLMVKEVPLTVDTIEGAGATSANTVAKNRAVLHNSSGRHLDTRGHEQDSSRHDRPHGLRGCVPEYVQHRAR